MIDYFFLFRDDDFLRTKSTTTVPISRALKKSFANLYCLFSDYDYVQLTKIARVVSFLLLFVLFVYVELCTTCFLERASARFHVMWIN
jgi:hypothetical protein